MPCIMYYKKKRLWKKEIKEINGLKSINAPKLGFERGRSSSTLTLHVRFRLTATGVLKPGYRALENDALGEGIDA